MSCRDRVAVVQTKSSPTDVVTQPDRAAEKLIRERLLAARPGDAILGEEGGETGTGPVRWIVDPLDGTVNFLYGLPAWAVSIAAEVDGVVVAGAVCVPLQRSMFRATLGGGAWLDSAWDAGPQRLACNTGVALRSALVATGFGYAARAASRAGPRWWRPCCRGCATSGERGGRRRPVLGRRRARRCLLRAGHSLLGHRGGRADRARGRRGDGRPARRRSRDGDDDGGGAGAVR